MEDLKGLIISCQATVGEPLYGYNVMGVMAKAAVEGGAIAIRTSGLEDIKSIKKMVSVPIIGLIKQAYEGSSVYITPTLKEIKDLCESECDIIAMDATNRSRPNGEQLATLVEYVKKNYPNKKIMADIATVEEAMNADSLKFDYISTTLRGYTEETSSIAIPDYSMIKETVKKVKSKVIAEGGIWEVGQLNKILKLNVFGVVIGTSVTRPKDITARFKRVFDSNKNYKASSNKTI